MKVKILLIMLSCFISAEIIGMDKAEYVAICQAIEKECANKLKKYITSGTKDHYTREILKFKEQINQYGIDLYKKENDVLDAFKTNHNIDDTLWNQYLETIDGLKKFHTRNVRNPFLCRQNDKGIPAQLRKIITEELEKKGIHQDYLQLKKDKKISDIMVVRSGMKVVEYEPYFIPSQGIIKINPRGFMNLSSVCKKGLCIAAVTLADPQVSVVYNVLQIFPFNCSGEIIPEELSSVSLIYIQNALARCALRDQETAIALKVAYSQADTDDIEGFRMLSEIAMIWEKLAHNEVLKAESMNDID